MPEVTVSGLKINYRDTGGEGPPIVLVHGFTGNVRNWALNIPALRGRFRCVSFDLPGHGLSERPADQDSYALPQMAEVVWGAIQALGLQKPVLMGHSMGGMISEYVALDHTEALRALVLVDTAAETIAIRDMDREKMVTAARSGGIEAAFELQLANTEPRVREDARFVALWREQFLMTSADAYIGGALAMARRESLIPRLKGLQLPALIICGENDLPFLGPSRRMHEAIPGSELAIIEGAGHSPTFETPEKFNAVLTAFLDRVAAAAPA
jgi:pimeloyl-ACP methyl ester carboxylesterase